MLIVNKWAQLCKDELRAIFARREGIKEEKIKEIPSEQLAAMLEKRERHYGH